MGIKMVRQKGGRLTMSDVAYARQLRRVIARDKRNEVKRANQAK